MNKTQRERYSRIITTLTDKGFTPQEIDQLLLDSKRLSTWGCHECNGVIQRDEKTGVPYWYSTHDNTKLNRAPDREAGCLRRVKAIVAAHGLEYYYQTDPRGCAIYVIRPGDVPDGQDVGGYYSRGIAICID